MSFILDPKGIKDLEEFLKRDDLYLVGQFIRASNNKRKTYSIFSVSCAYDTIIISYYAILEEVKYIAFDKAGYEYIYNNIEKKLKTLKKSFFEDEYTTEEKKIIESLEKWEWEKEKKQQQGVEMKEEREQQEQEEMTREQEKELIIKNAFEFLNKENLICMLDDCDIKHLSKGIICIDEPVNNYDIFHIKWIKQDNFLSIVYKTEKGGNLERSDNKELINLFLQKHDKLTSEFNKRIDLKNFSWNKQPQDDYYLRKHDKGKPKLLQVPVEAITAISEIMDYGSNKYGAGFWDKVEVERYMQAAARHLFACQNDINSIDEESGHKHIKHALCNLAYVVALIEREESKEK